MSTRSYRGSRNLLSPHVGADYGAVTTYHPPGWTHVFVCPKPGESFVAKGGEFAPGFEIAPGRAADRIDLAAGARATVLGWDETTFLADWLVEPPAS